MSRSRRLRELSGAAAYDQLQAQLARAAAGMARKKPLPRQGTEQTLRPAGPEPDVGHEDVVPIGSG
ncbi:hypothetical protein [Streptomyces sp. NPDC047009]|uniref:hypothetical protein n=1 Tax=unclassified Streptomyces TaxID=2593676 RepID=UPI00340BC11A